MNDTKKGGFIDYKPPTNEKRCLDEQHNPPGLILLKPGEHTYKCPSCGEITIINVPLITC